MRSVVLISVFLGSSILASAAFAQGPMGAEPGAPAMGPGQMPQPAKLTTKDVERLLKVIPEVAKESAKHMTPGGAPPSQEEQRKQMEQVEVMLKAQGLTVLDFAQQMATLVS